MATQATNFNSADRLIREAYLNAGLIGAGVVPNGEQIMRGQNRLNDLINFLQTKGLKLWLNSYLTVPLVAGTQVYTLGPSGTGTRQMRVLEGYYFDSNSVSRPLQPLAWSDWGALSNKSQTGAITGYFVDKQQLNTAVSFWLIPDATAATGSVKLLVQSPVGNSISFNDNLFFPTEWYLGLMWALSDELAIGQPEAIVKACAEKRMMYLDALEAWDVEDAPTLFAPSTTNQQRSSFT